MVWRVSTDANIASVTNAVVQFRRLGHSALRTQLERETDTIVLLQQIIKSIHKKKILSKCLIAAVAFLTAMPVMAEELQPRAEILTTPCVKVNDHYLKNTPTHCFGIPYYSRVKKVYEANIWTRAVYFEDRWPCIPYIPTTDITIMPYRGPTASSGHAS